jgi:hypothetical protein
MLFRKEQLPNRLLLDKDDLSTRLIEPENVGLDISLNSEGDLLINSKGDIEILNPDKSIAISLLRRVLTPFGGYSRVFREDQVLIEEGLDLENIAYSYLSSSKTSTLTQDLKVKLKELAEIDERIEVIDVTIKPSGLTDINLNLTYKTKGSNIIKTLIYQYN